MKPGYTEFNETILNVWKDNGIRYVRSEVLKQDKNDEYGAQSAVEITPEFVAYDDVNTQPIDSSDVHEYARKSNSEIIYVVKKKNV